MQNEDNLVWKVIIAIAAIAVAYFIFKEFVQPGRVGAINAQVAICHRTEAEVNPFNAQLVAVSALDTHLEHGDFLYSGEFVKGKPSEANWCSDNVPSVTPSVTPTVTPSVTPSVSVTPTVTTTPSATVVPSTTPALTATPAVVEQKTVVPVGSPRTGAAR